MKVYRLNVTIIGLSRVLRGFDVSGACTFDKLHEAIFHAFNRHDERAYAFYLTKAATQDRMVRMGAPLIVASDNAKVSAGKGQDCRSATGTTVASAQLAPGDVLYYLFDFKEEWWHRIDVKTVADIEGDTEPILLAESVGGAPVQHEELEEDDDDDEDDDDEG